MAVTAASSLQLTVARPSILSARKLLGPTVTGFGLKSDGGSWVKLSSGSHISAIQHYQHSFMSSTSKFDRVITKAMSESGEKKPSSGLPIDLKGLILFPTNFY